MQLSTLELEGRIEEELELNPALEYNKLSETDEVDIPFDTEYTKLSADSQGMYFDLFMEGFQPERYYKIMFRIDNSEGINIHDEGYFFKVVR